MNRKIVIIILIIIIVFLIMFVKMKHVENNEDIKQNEKETVDLEIDISKYESKIKEVFSNVEKDYQDAKEYYERKDFYNEVRFNMITNDKIEIINLDDIDKNLEKYNSRNEKIEEFPKEIYKGKEIKISSKYEIDTGNYYLIRYQNIEENKYTVYFIGYLGKEGFEGYSLYCIVNGEYFQKEN